MLGEIIDQILSTVIGTGYTVQAVLFLGFGALILCLLFRKK